MSDLKPDDLAGRLEAHAKCEDGWNEDDIAADLREAARRLRTEDSADATDILYRLRMAVKSTGCPGHIPMFWDAIAEIKRLRTEPSK